MDDNVETEGEVHLKYRMSFTLRHLSAASVVAMLWSHARIHAAIKKALSWGMGYQPIVYAEAFHPTRMKWESIESKVSESAAKLHATKSDLKFLLYLIKRMGVELFQWIRFMDDYVFDIRDNGKDKDINFVYSIFNGLPCAVSVAVDHLDSLVWTCMGQIDYKRTAIHLLRSGDFDDNLRFELACDFCLEEYIRELWDTSQPGVTSRADSLINFWTSELTENFEDLEEEVNTNNDENNLDYDVKEFVFYWALGRNNETAAWYMWDNYREEFNDWQYFPKAIKEAGCVFNANFMCHLLTQADQEEQEDSFEYTYHQILKCLLDNWLWGGYLWVDHYLPTLRRVKKMMDPDDFDEPLEVVAKCIAESHESYRCNYKDIFKELWQYCPKEHMFKLKDGVPMCNEILCSLFGRKNKDLVQLILSDANVQQRKKMLFSPKGIVACKNLLVNKEWDLLEMFLERAFESEEDLKKFKKELKAKKSANISQYLKKDEWNWAEKFLNSSFKDPKELEKLKLELAVEDRNEVVTELIKNSFDGGALDLAQVDDFLRWCLSSDTNVRQFKLAIISNELKKWNTTLHKLVRELIEIDDLKSADLLLKWCISNERDLQEEIEVFKNKYILEIFKDATKRVEIIVGAFEKYRLQALLTWFDPTKEILKDCRELLEVGKCPKRLMTLLDDFIEGKKGYKDSFGTAKKRPRI